MGDPNEAIAQLRELIRLDPTHAAAHNDLGSLHAMQGNLTTALEHFEEAVRLDPGDAAARQNLDTARKAQGLWP
jgi:Flp pilus assembly protein TadD